LKGDVFTFYARTRWRLKALFYWSWILLVCRSYKCAAFLSDGEIKNSTNV